MPLKMGGADEATIESAGGLVTVKEGYAMTGRPGLDVGHEVINWEASVYTMFKSSGVSNGPVHGACLRTGA